MVRVAASTQLVILIFIIARLIILIMYFFYRFLRVWLVRSK
jgi:hypothetical protein